jgi:ribosome biogenesis protein ERB1
VQWNPNKGVPLLAVIHEKFCSLLAPQGLFSSETSDNLRTLLADFKANHVPPVEVGNKKLVTKWKFEEEGTEEYTSKDLRITLECQHVLKTMRWHSKGDYFSTLADNIQTSSQVLIHSLSKASTQKPFSKTKGILEAIEFHPTRPLFYICNSTHVFCYNLQKQSLAKKFLSGVRMISSISVHPKGDNFILGSYDKKIMWFDEETGSTPYKKLKYHAKAI